MRLKTITTFLAIAAALSQAAMAQTPSEYNLPGKQYPMINPDRTVTFRIEAPKAKSVVINLGKPYPMSSMGDGQWTVTTEPVAPGFHYYSLTIDGVRGTDPATQVFFGSGTQMSGIEVPELCTGFYLEKDVPHGEVREQRYWSELTGSWRVCNVYVPAQYLQDAESRFPVLYLLHGAGEDETGWIYQGFADVIMDNLIAEGKAEPMIIVMNSGYAQHEGSSDSFDAFEQMITEEVIPFVDARYRTIADREHRATAGLSWGAKQAYDLALGYPQYFSAVGGFSGIIVVGEFGRSNPGIMDKTKRKAAYNGIFANPKKFNKDFSVLFIANGEAEGSHLADMSKTLKKDGIKNTFYQSPETAHEWLTWRRCLYNYAQLIFKK